MKPPFCTRCTTAALGALLLMSAVCASAQTFTITFDAGDPIGGLTPGTVLGTQYAAATGVTFTPNGLSGAGAPNGTWATNTDVTIVDSAGADVGGLGTPALVSGRILRSFNGWLSENGDPSLRMSLASAASSCSVTFAGIATVANSRLIAFDAGGAQVAAATAAGPGQQVVTVNAAAIASVVILPGDFNDWVGIDNITCTLAIVAPTVTYAPAPGSSVGFTGVTTIGTSGNGTIVATPAGGGGSGTDATTTVNGCTLGGANPGSFAGAAAVNLSFVGTTTTAQNINLTCTSQQAAQSATLTCNETRGGAAAVQRQWQLSCPAGTPIAPSIAYNPTTGTTVNLSGVTTIGSTGSAAIAATPSGGIGTGAGATTTINGCTFGGANPGAFAGAAAVNLSFVGSSTTAQNINVTCNSQLTAQAATLTCNETRGGAGAVQRQWPLSCPAGALLPLTSAPASGASITFPTLFPNSPTSSIVTFTNPNPVPVSLNCSIPAPSVFSVAPATVNVSAGGTANATVTLLAPTAGNYSGTLTCAIAGGQAFTYSLSGQVLVATPIPSNDMRGLLLLGLLVLMIGLPVLSRQQR